MNDKIRYINLIRSADLESCTMNEIATILNLFRILKIPTMDIDHDKLQDEAKKQYDDVFGEEK